MTNKQLEKRIKELEDRCDYLGTIIDDHITGNNIIVKQDSITLEEFWNSEEDLAIHCDTEEKANILLKAFDDMGKIWANENLYTFKNEWQYHKKETCYVNDGMHCSLDFAKKEHIKIYEFEDVILPQVKDKFKVNEKAVVVNNGKFNGTIGRIVDIDYKNELCLLEITSEDYKWYNFKHLEPYTEPKFTDDEKVILRNLPAEYKWIAREKSGILVVGIDILERYHNANWIGRCRNLYWYDHLFQSIKWEDEPCEFRKYL